MVLIFKGIVPKMILPTVTQQLKPELPLDSPAVCQQYPVSKIRNHNAGAWNHEVCMILRMVLNIHVHVHWLFYVSNIKILPVR